MLKKTPKFEGIINDDQIGNKIFGGAAAPVEGIYFYAKSNV